MPELPEVETIRRSLAPLVEGRRITALEVRDPRWCAPLAPEEIADAVVGRTIEALSRRGKWLVYELEGEVFLITHLRMTGAFLYDPQADAPYERVRIGLGDGHELRFCDPRRFGTGELAFGAPALDDFFASRVGLEPLGDDLNGAVLHALTRGSRAPVKAFLLDQKRIAGVGNIYADEALFRAQIHPLRRAGALTRAQTETLARHGPRRAHGGPRGRGRDDRRLPPPGRRAAGPSSTSSSSTGARARTARAAAARS